MVAQARVANGSFARRARRRAVACGNLTGPIAVPAAVEPGDRPSDDTEPTIDSARHDPGDRAQRAVGSQSGERAGRRIDVVDAPAHSPGSGAVTTDQRGVRADRAGPRGVADATDATALVLELDRRRTSDSAAVRRDVSRALANLSVQQPTLAVATAHRWLAEGGPHTHSVVRRGLRPLVLARDDTALRLAGYSPAAPVRVVDLEIDAERTPAFGGELVFSARVVSATLQPAPVLVEYRVEHRASSGELRRAAGRLLSRTLDPLADVSVRRTHRLPRQPSSRWSEGPCRLVVTINGRDDATATFTP
jgi:hypothetical protein